MLSHVNYSDCSRLIFEFSSTDKETEGDRHQTLGGSKISNRKREEKQPRKKKMNGGSDDFDNLEHTHIPESVYSQEGFSNFPSLPLMGSSIEDYLRLSNMSPADLPNNNHACEKAEMGIDLQTEMGFDSQQEYNSHLMQEPLHNPHIPLQQFNWADSIDGIQGMKFYNHQQQQDLYQQQQYNLQCFTSTSSYAEAAPELLNLLQLPGCSAAAGMLPAPSVNIYSELPMTQSIATPTEMVLYNQLNFTSHEPVFRELFHGLPHNCSIPVSRAGSSFDGMDVKDEDEGLYQEVDGRNFENSVLDFRRGKGKGQGKGEVKVTERNRRDKFNEKYSELRLLLPNSTKSDKARASILSGTIDYIKELRGTVEELKMLVKKKRFQKERRKRLKMEDEMVPDMESSFMKSLADGEQSINAPMRSSWLLRKSKETVIDVRVIDDEVNIKVTQRRKVNCLLLVGEVLDELQMELLHASGGNIGDYNIFMFNTKVTEGSSVYAAAIAQKLIEALDNTKSN